MTTNSNVHPLTEFKRTHRSNTTFSFSANGVAVPDGGSAVALLGLALTGIEVLRRRLKLG
jgi:hypothetical protein